MGKVCSPVVAALSKHTYDICVRCVDAAGLGRLAQKMALFFYFAVKQIPSPDQIHS